GRIPNIDEELASRIYGLCVPGGQALHFCAGRFRTGGGSESCQSGNILPEVCPWAKIVIPATHVFAWSGQADTLTINLEELVFTQIQEELVILIKLTL